MDKYENKDTQWVSDEVTGSDTIMNGIDHDVGVGVDRLEQGVNDLMEIVDRLFGPSVTRAEDGPKVAQLPTIEPVGAIDRLELNVRRLHSALDDMDVQLHRIKGL